MGCRGTRRSSEEEGCHTRPACGISAVALARQCSVCSGCQPAGDSCTKICHASMLLDAAISEAAGCLRSRRAGPKFSAHRYWPKPPERRAETLGQRMAAPPLGPNGGKRQQLQVSKPLDAGSRASSLARSLGVQHFERTPVSSVVHVSPFHRLYYRRRLPCSFPPPLHPLSLYPPSSHRLVRGVYR